MPELLPIKIKTMLRKRERERERSEDMSGYVRCCFGHVGESRGLFQK